MPIFGLVWVASWVGCFFPSNQDLLATPAYPTCVLSASSSSTPSTEGLSTSVSDQPIASQSKKRLSTAVPINRDRAAIGFQPAEGAVKPEVEFKKTSQPASSPAVGSSPIVISNSPVFSELIQNLLHVVGVSLTPGKTPPRSALARSRSPQASPIPPKPGGVSREARHCSASGGDALKPLIPVRFQGHLIGKVPDSQQATLIRNQLELAFEAGTLNATDIQPALIKGLPVIRLGDRTLIPLSPVLDDSECNSERVAVAWVNNLRAALAEPSLSITDAQQKMLRLQETDMVIEGLASWYGPYFHGRQTATGEVFDQNELTAAHPTLPFDTYLRVTNLLNGKSVIVRVNDRGPYFDNRMLDLSYAAARQIDSEVAGVVPVEAVIMVPTGDTRPSVQTAARP